MGEVCDLTIAGLHFQVHTPYNVQMTDSFRPFVGTGEKTDWLVTFSEVPEDPPVHGKERYSEITFSVYETAHGFVRFYPDRSVKNGIYAASSADWEKGTVEVCYHPREIKFLNTIEKCFSHTGFEELLAARGRMILHASLVDTPFGGILFSGPSGIGKSTQAELWHTWEGGTVINGDRPILYCRDGRWMACGSPYAGSSEYYVNASVPVAAIVLLEQGDTCEVRPAAPLEAFRHLYGQTVVNTWNGAYVEKVCDMALALSRHVPVYWLRCTPDKRAVDTLKAALEKGVED